MFRELLLGPLAAHCCCGGRVALKIGWLHCPQTLFAARGMVARGPSLENNIRGNVGTRVPAISYKDARSCVESCQRQGISCSGHGVKSGRLSAAPVHMAGLRFEKKSGQPSG